MGRPQEVLRPRAEGAFLKARGAIDLYLALATVVVIAAITGGVYYVIKSYGASERQRGVDETNLTWTQRENRELAFKNAKLLELEEKYRRLEQEGVAAVAALDRKHAKEIENVRKVREAAVADSDRFRLRWTAGCTAGERSNRSETAGAAPTSSGSSGTATCELPRQTREDLIRLAADADEVVNERNTLLEIAKRDRETK